MVKTVEQICEMMHTTINVSYEKGASKIYLTIW